MNKSIISILTLSLVIIISSCEKTTVELAPPDIEFDSVKNILMNSVEGYATILNTDKNRPISFGFILNNKRSLTVADSVIIKSDSINFHDTITGLSPDVDYFIKAFVHNFKDTIYSAEVSFITWDGKITDYDGNVYEGVQIGNQGWMAENLKSTHYSDGTRINSFCPEINYYWYESYYPLEEDISKEEYIDKYGLIYPWWAANNVYPNSCNGWKDKKVAVNSNDVCPTGWHIPNNEEWQELINFVEGDAKHLKSEDLWLETNGSNTYGFNARPAGHKNEYGCFYIYERTWYHSSVQANSANAYCIGLTDSNDEISFGFAGITYSGRSVRCIKDK